MLRLDRMLVTLGKGSRSEMQKAIRGGRVRVNGDVQRDPSAQVGQMGWLRGNFHYCDRI